MISTFVPPRSTPRRTSAMPLCVPALRMNERTPITWRSALVDNATSKSRKRPMIKTDRQLELEAVMGKYVLAWLLGVPAFVLVVIYMFAH
jgi:hypothetical protein